MIQEIEEIQDELFVGLTGFIDIHPKAGRTIIEEVM